jgi:hypothetical protein
METSVFDIANDLSEKQHLRLVASGKSEEDFFKDEREATVLRVIQTLRDIGNELLTTPEE